MSSPLLKASRGKGGTGIYIKGVTVRFGFDLLELRKLYGLSKTKQRERLMGCIIDSHHWLRSDLSSVVKEDDLYIYTGVGLSALLVSTDMSNTNGMVRK